MITELEATDFHDYSSNYYNAYGNNGNDTNFDYGNNYGDICDNASGDNNIVYIYKLLPYHMSSDSINKYTNILHNSSYSLIIIIFKCIHSRI